VSSPFLSEPTEDAFFKTHFELWRFGAITPAEIHFAYRTFAHKYHESHPLTMLQLIKRMKEILPGVKRAIVYNDNKHYRGWELTDPPGFHYIPPPPAKLNEEWLYNNPDWVKSQLEALKTLGINTSRFVFANDVFLIVQDIVAFVEGKFHQPPKK